MRKIRSIVPVKVKRRCGLCACGCCEQTTICTKTSRRAGNYIGFPNRFVRGHQARLEKVRRLSIDCLACGEAFHVLPCFHSRKFCSYKCVVTFRKTAPIKRTRAGVTDCCRVCGGWFYYPKSRNQKFCSNACYVRFRKKHGIFMECAECRLFLAGRIKRRCCTHKQIIKGRRILVILRRAFQSSDPITVLKQGVNRNGN